MLRMKACRHYRRGARRNTVSVLCEPDRKLRKNRSGFARRSLHSPAPEEVAEELAPFIFLEHEQNLGTEVHTATRSPLPESTLPRRSGKPVAIRVSRHAAVSRSKTSKAMAYHPVADRLTCLSIFRLVGCRSVRVRYPCDSTGTIADMMTAAKQLHSADGKPEGSPPPRIIEGEDGDDEEIAAYPQSSQHPVKNGNAIAERKVLTLCKSSATPCPATTPKLKTVSVPAQPGDPPRPPPLHPPG